MSDFSGRRQHQYPDNWYDMITSCQYDNVNAVVNYNINEK